MHLKVAKKGAIKHGLAELLVQTEMPQGKEWVQGSWVQILVNSGQIVHLKVAKKGAIKYGLAELLVQTEMLQGKE